jgi:hypothetical protein
VEAMLTNEKLTYLVGVMKAAHSKDTKKVKQLMSQAILFNMTEQEVVEHLGGSVVLS